MASGISNASAFKSLTKSNGADRNYEYLSFSCLKLQDPFSYIATIA
jgi:hypothetical protein